MQKCIRKSPKLWGPLGGISAQHAREPWDPISKGVPGTKSPSKDLGSEGVATKHENRKVFAEVEGGWPVAKSLRNTIPTFLAVLNLVSPPKMTSQSTRNEKIIFSWFSGFSIGSDKPFGPNIQARPQDPACNGIPWTQYPRGSLGSRVRGPGVGRSRHEAFWRNWYKEYLGFVWSIRSIFGSS